MVTFFMVLSAVTLEKCASLFFANWFDGATTFQISFSRFYVDGTNNALDSHTIWGTKKLTGQSKRTSKSVCNIRAFVPRSK
jgi:hypothetical protein